MRTASVTRGRIQNEERWAEMALSLADPFDGGPLLLYPRDFSCQLKGADDRAATYDLKNWESVVMSGAFYAFRSLKRPRTRLLVSTLQGCLRSEDLLALALAATIGVTELLDGDSSRFTLPEWQYRVNP